MIFIALILLGAAACSRGGSSATPAPSAAEGPSEKPVSSQQVQGAINGHAWRFKSGKAVVYEKNDSPYLEISLWDEKVQDPCSEMQGSNFQIRLYSEVRPGIYEITNQDPFAQFPAIIFSDFTERNQPKNNIVASEGQIHLTVITDAGVTGEIQGSFPVGLVDKTQVEGSFQVPFCGPAPMAP